MPGLRLPPTCYHLILTSHEGNPGLQVRKLKLKEGKQLHLLISLPPSQEDLRQLDEGSAKGRPGLKPQTRTSESQASGTCCSPEGCSLLHFHPLGLWERELLLHACSVVSDSLQPPGLQPTRLLCPQDFPGKNTGVGCHALLQGIFLTLGLNSLLLHCRHFLYHCATWEVHKFDINMMLGFIFNVCCAQSLQSCPTLCDTMDCSPPGSVHGILQARILEQVSNGEDLPHSGIEPESPGLQTDSFTAELPGKPFIFNTGPLNIYHHHHHHLWLWLLDLDLLGELQQLTVRFSLFLPQVKGEDCLSGLSNTCMFFRCFSNKNKSACGPLTNGMKCLVPINLLIGPERKLFHLHLEPNLR